MGKKNPIVSFFCGIFTGRKKPLPPPIEESEKREENNSDSSNSGAPENATGGGESPEKKVQPLPPPPGAGAHHMRTVSCQHTRSNSGVSKLVSSLSLSLRTGREEKSRQKDNKFRLKHEDSIWKKTIILGEKCRVPDEDEQDILYDEKGNKFSTYHPKTHSGVLTFSRQSSNVNEQEDQSSKR